MFSRRFPSREKARQEISMATADKIRGLGIVIFTLCLFQGWRSVIRLEAEGFLESFAGL